MSLQPDELGEDTSLSIAGCAMEPVGISLTTIIGFRSQAIITSALWIRITKGYLVEGCPTVWTRF
jgi:hypothetical protein